MIFEEKKRKLKRKYKILLHVRSAASLGHYQLSSVLSLSHFALKIGQENKIAQNNHKPNQSPMMRLKDEWLRRVYLFPHAGWNILQFFFCHSVSVLLCLLLHIVVHLIRWDVFLPSFVADAFSRDKKNALELVYCDNNNHLWRHRVFFLLAWCSLPARSSAV